MAEKTDLVDIALRHFLSICFVDKRKDMGCPLGRGFAGAEYAINIRSCIADYSAWLGVYSQPPLRVGEIIGNEYMNKQAQTTSQIDSSERKAQSPLQIIGRTGSLFSRVALIFAEEAGVDYELVLLDDLIATDLQRYSGNPALRIPVLRMGDEVLFGTRNICRVLAAQAKKPLYIVWPEDMSDILMMNAEEIIRQSMTAQVQLLMMEDYGGGIEASPLVAKTRAGLDASLRWLGENLEEVIAGLSPERSFSMLEVELFCLVEHLQFAPTVGIEEHASLLGFARAFGERNQVRRTVFG